MFKKSLLTMLLMVILAPWAANAQQALPYSYGFENNDLATEGWTAQIESSSSGISSSYAYEGTYSFKFSYTEESGYLVSPLLTGTDAGIDLTFYYYESSNYYGDEEFYVGYTTDETVTDPADFTYGSIVTASTSWQEYTTFLPAGTKRIAISYVYNDALSLYLDAFSFEAPGAVAKPTDLVVSDITAYGATLAWTENGTATSWEICVNDDETNLIPTTSNPYTFANLTPQTTYSVKVRAVAGDESSAWSSPVSFTTAEVCPDGMVCIGQGTATNSYIPTYTYYNYSLTQQIYTAEEIGESGSILSVDFHASAAKTRNLDIYMVSTTKSSFESATDWITVTEADKVFSGEVTFAAADWTTIEFDNPFDYNGTSNIALIVDDNTGSYENSPSFYAFSATSQALRIYSDGTNYDPFAPTSYSGTILTQKNRIRLAIGEPPTCPKPKNLAVSEITNHTATFSWTAGGEETAWQLCVNGNETNPTNVTTNPYTLTGLSSETDYTVKLRANCGGGDYSDWTGEISFTTDIACPAPTNVTVSDVAPYSAIVSWEGTSGSFSIRYGIAEPDPSQPATIIVTAGDVWGDGTGYQMLLDADATAYGNEIPASGAYTGSDYSAFEYLVPTNADCDTYTSNLVFNNSVTIQIPAGVYDWCFTNPEPGGNMWIASGNGNVGGRYDDYEFLGGYTYEFVPSLFEDNHDGIDVTISCSNVTWTTLNNVTSPYTLTNLSEETMYAVEVQSVCGGEDGSSVWATGGMFKTPSACGAPTELASADITLDGATLSWQGFTNTYNLQYRTAESRVIYYFNNFNNELAEGWTSDYFIYGFDDPIYDVAGADNHFLEMGWNSTSEETIISCELPDYDFGSYVEFYYFGYQTANTFQVGYSTTTNDADAFTWSDPIDAPQYTYTRYLETLATGVKYIAWKATASSQAASIFIDDFGIFGETIEAGDWETVSAVTSPYELSGLADDTKYEWQVQGVKTSCTGGVTEWSESAFFTTLSACQTPTNLEATDITAVSATLNWEGIQEDYVLRYRALEHYGNVAFADDFTNGIGNWTLVNCHDNSQAYPENGYFRFYWSSNPPQYLISPVLPSEASGMNLSFTYARTSTTWVETFQLGFSTTDNDVDSFTWEDEVTVDGESGSWYYYTTTVPDGAKYFAIKCTSDDQYYLYVSNFNINDGTIVPTGDWMEEDVRIDDLPFTIDGLEPGGVAYEWQVKGDGCDDMAWSAPEYFYTLDAPATQVTDLTEGWNWFSIYVAIEDGEEEEAMLKLQESLGTNGLTIKSIDDFTTYASGDWGDSGDLDAVDNLNMYMIQVGADCTVELDGTPADPGDYTITIVNGWNWVGFPSAEVISIEDAFADFEAADGDQIKTKDDYSTYADGWGDTGDLEELTPGQGFLYYSSSSTPKPLIISTGSGKRAVSAKPVVIRSAMPLKEVKSDHITGLYKSVK